MYPANMKGKRVFRRTKAKLLVHSICCTFWMVAKSLLLSIHVLLCAVGHCVEIFRLPVHTTLFHFWIRKTRGIGFVSCVLMERQKLYVVSLQKLCALVCLTCCCSWFFFLFSSNQGVVCENHFNIRKTSECDVMWVCEGLMFVLCHSYRKHTHVWQCHRINKRTENRRLFRCLSRERCHCDGCSVDVSTRQT